MRACDCARLPTRPPYNKNLHLCLALPTPLRPCQVPELPAAMALPEFLHTSGMDVVIERRQEVVPPFFKYMRTKLASLQHSCIRSELWRG